MKFGEKIRTLREEQGFSQEELAHRTELSPLVISAFEDGSALPKTGGAYTRGSRRRWIRRSDTSWKTIPRTVRKAAGRLARRPLFLSRPRRKKADIPHKPLKPGAQIVYNSTEQIKIGRGIPERL